MRSRMLNCMCAPGGMSLERLHFLLKRRDARLSSESSGLSAAHLSASPTNTGSSALMRNVSAANAPESGTGTMLPPGLPLVELRTLFLEESLRPLLVPYVPQAVGPYIESRLDPRHASDMRRLTIMFVNGEPNWSSPAEELETPVADSQTGCQQAAHFQSDALRQAKIIQAAFERIYPVVTEFHGFLNKVITFDKGIFEYSYEYSSLNYKYCLLSIFIFDIFLGLHWQLPELLIRG